MPQSGLDLVAEERERQLREEGWTDAHDDIHTDGALAMAAACYAAPRYIYVIRTIEKDRAPIDAWPRSLHFAWDKRIANRVCLDTPKTRFGRAARVRELSKAGALIVAEIDRLQRLELAEGPRS